MVKTEFYVAGGDVMQMSTKLTDCTKICEIDGILYDNDGNTLKWVWGIPEYSKEKWNELALNKYQLYVEGKIEDLLS